MKELTTRFINFTLKVLYQCICKQAGTLWRQTWYRTICSPPFPALHLPSHSLLQSRKAEMKVWKEMENKLFICIWEETKHLSKCSLHSLLTLHSKVILGWWYKRDRNRQRAKQLSHPNNQMCKWKRSLWFPLEHIRRDSKANCFDTLLILQW